VESGLSRLLPSVKDPGAAAYSSGMRKLVVALTALAVVLAAGVSAQGATSISFCKGVQLTGTFAAVPGSAGAGNISYLLVLRNRSTRICLVTGLPQFRLLGHYGKALPTRTFPSHPGFATAVLVTLRPGQVTSVTARFSPDVPGVGEPANGPQCERTAYRLQVFARGGGSSVVPILPVTPVCEHGSMQVSVYVFGRHVLTG